ncbi:beta-glucuronidase [Anseongella ginsenosidimutans]|uniref:Beta-glucuronidase n=1 Tax=Anseongella ginsenosidimutans TaxID=496056 RepID=A0A4R3KNF9_9SPHI|nr:sugar-binding domain-containing protein [Anseongella ginsenosidimutans]QEC52424.1 twin-arginine translocation signal domain-containing protein [Anseongella ginsenosidimutans]TCS85830.1 beta-glucuronidase [Anseongella ginsenosidimutans]
MLTRRNFLKNAGGTGALAMLPALTLSAEANRLSGSGKTEEAHDDLLVSLNGPWLFRTDPDDRGDAEKWYELNETSPDWETVSVPHTWQVDQRYHDYLGTAWYRKVFTVPEDWMTKTLRVEFEAVYHSAKVWLNGKYAGEHLRKGYTAFMLDLSGLIRPGENYLVVQAGNRYDDQMLPRNNSYDWAADGGITRPVSLYITPKTYAENVRVTALPDLEQGTATIKVQTQIANTLEDRARLSVTYEILEDRGNRLVLSSGEQVPVVLRAGEHKIIEFPDQVLEKPLLWHFDSPNLYHIVVSLSIDGRVVHTKKDTFGVRKIEVRDAGFYLNGERVWLAGVERMAGSHPEYGMAEPASWIRHDHEDMKNLNCIFTRVHWQQDKRVLDYCDRHGMLIQVEVPTWGGGTFKGMKEEPDQAIMQNGLEQLKEMIGREYNRPSVFSWGLCNEIGGQNPPAYKFAENMLKEAKRLDPYRLCAYASNTLHYTPEKDVSKLMDFIEWNEYHESWLGGDTEDMEKNLQAIHKAFPDKPLVISEYGWCRCAPDRKEGDEKLISILKRHNAIFRKHDYVAGLIFFSYNDYRTHRGDKGIGILKQRVHGVVDLYGSRHPSYYALQEESSPVESLDVSFHDQALHVSIDTRKLIPAYTLRNYRLRWIGYADQDIPLETAEITLPDMKPGYAGAFEFKTSLAAFEKIKVEVLRPTGSVAARARLLFK